LKTDNLEAAVRMILEPAGIQINGNQPRDIRIHNRQFYQRALSQGSLGLGESYMDGWWDCERLDEFFFHLLRTEAESQVKKSPGFLFQILRPRIFNMQSRRRAFQIGEKHYDLGNDLFSRMLDRRLVYSCAYWKSSQTLDEAQESKLDLICQKLGLEPGMKILDIGCGWGGLLKYAAEKYRVQGVGITVSKEQAELGRKICAGLPVEIRLQDYRDLKEKFDRIVSVGMIEHVGYKNYPTYMQIVSRCLNDNGLFLLHTIGGNTSVKAVDPWMNKYIFPNGMLPSIRQLGGAIEGLWVMEDWHNFSADYDQTLMAWNTNFEDRWDEIKAKYNERFHRMWSYYLLSCAGAFRARRNQLWQIVLSPKGVAGGYRSIR
jgi:cyclopropane-fatty-acyl-phospholipid synthase